MGIVFKIISVSLQSILTVYLILTFAEHIKNIKYNKLNKFIFYITTIIASVISMNYKDTYVLISIAILGITVLVNIIFNLKLKISSSIALELSTFLLFSITEVLITSALLGVTNLSAQDVSTTPLYSFIFSLIQLGFILLLILLAKYIIKNIKNFEYIIKNVTLKTLIMLLISLVICIVPQLLIFAISKYNYSPLFILINSIQMILICIIIFITLKESVERDKAESDLVTTKLHNNTMTGMIDGLKTLKHDYNNIMQALNGYVSTKQYDKLQEHINKVLKECNIVNTLGLIDPKIFNDPAIYGIVGAKYFLITEADITMDLEIVTNIKEINFPMPELSRILGILLDNALEATQKCNNPYVKLEMRFDTKKCADVIRVINTYDTSINIDLENIYKKGFSSKKVKSGIGLWEVKKIISKIPHAQVYPTIEKNKFVQNIIIEKI